MHKAFQNSRGLYKHTQTKKLDLTSVMDSATLERGTLAATVFAENLSEVYETNLTEIGHI